MPTDPTFRMTVQDVFFIKSRGTVVTGRVESGTLSVGDEILILGRGINRTTAVAGVESNRKVVTQVRAGDNAGILFKDLTNEDVQQGDVLAGSATEFAWKP